MNTNTENGTKTINEETVNEAIPNLTEEKPNNIHDCPKGQKWSDALNKCVDDPTA